MGYKRKISDSLNLNDSNTQASSKAINDLNNLKLDVDGDGSQLTNLPIVNNPNKVDKISGKALSSNDFTNTLKTKLDGISTSADVNRPISDSITSTSTSTSASSKAVSDLSNISISNSTDTFGSKATNIITLSQQQYDGITPNASTLYFIT